METAAARRVGSTRRGRRAGKLVGRGRRGGSDESDRRGRGRGAKDFVSNEFENGLDRGEGLLIRDGERGLERVQRRGKCVEKVTRINGFEIDFCRLESSNRRLVLLRECVERFGRSGREGEGPESSEKAKGSLRVRGAKCVAKGGPVRARIVLAVGDVVDDGSVAGDGDGGDDKIVESIPGFLLDPPLASFRLSNHDLVRILTDQTTKLDAPDIVIFRSFEMRVGRKGCRTSWDHDFDFGFRLQRSGGFGGIRCHRIRRGERR